MREFRRFLSPLEAESSSAAESGMRRLVGKKHEIVVAGERTRDIQQDGHAGLKAQVRPVTMNL